MFPHCDGGLMRVTTIIRDLKRLGERVGVPGITFHSLQHFHASVSLQQHQNVVVVPEGWATPASSLRWTPMAT